MPRCGCNELSRAGGPRAQGGTHANQQSCDFKGQRLKSNTQITKEQHKQGLVVNHMFIISLIIEFIQRDQIMQLQD